MNLDIPAPAESQNVTAALIAADVIERTPTSKHGLSAVLDTFNSLARAKRPTNGVYQPNPRLQRGNLSR